MTTPARIDHNFNIPERRTATLACRKKSLQQPLFHPQAAPIPLAPRKTSVRQLIANGKAKTALDRAKDLHKATGSAASEALLIDAYTARIRSLLDQNLALEAKALLELVRERYPSARARLEELGASSAARAGALDGLLAPLNNPHLSPEGRAAIERAVQNNIADPASLAACASLPPDHPLRLVAAALARAFGAVTSGPVTDEEIALPEVSHRSPLAPWKLLVRAIACFYRGQDDACRVSLDAIKPESVPAKLVPAIRTMLGSPRADAAAPLTPSAVALVSRATQSSAALRSELEELDRTFADEDESEGRIFKLARAAMRECRQSAPEHMEALKRLLYVRGAMTDMDGERMIAALDGMPRQDASFFRTLARGMELAGDFAIACDWWGEFRVQAVREGWFAANGIEAATLYLHMAGVLVKTPSDLLRKCQRARRPDGKAGPEELYFLFPEKLYARACALDPHPEAFSQWLHWAEREPAARAEDVAKAWHKVRPMDLEPLLYLLREAEKRNAFPTALGYLDKAERIDAVHSVVRAARLRLLAGSALRHVQQKKPHLAAEKLAAMAALPQSRQGDRPAFLAALRYVIATERGDLEEAERAGAAAERLLGSDVAAGILASGLSAAAKRGAYALPPLQALSQAERSDLPVSIAKGAAILNDLGIPRVYLPMAYITEAMKQFPHAGGSLDTNQLRTLAETGLAAGNSELAYAVSAAGLNRDGSPEAPFLLLRARSLPLWMDDRRAACAAAAAELARPHRDMDTINQAVELVRGVRGPEPFSLTLERAGEVLRHEKAVPAYPSRNNPGPDYTHLMPDRLEPEDFLGGGLDGAINEEEMERIFIENAPDDLPPELSRMMFELLKEAYLNGESPDDILARLTGGGRAPGKGKKGRRK